MSSKYYSELDPKLSVREFPVDQVGQRTEKRINNMTVMSYMLTCSTDTCYHNLLLPLCPCTAATAVVLVQESDTDLGPVYTYRLRLRLCQTFIIVPMETDHLTDGMDTEPIMPIKRSISIDTIINFEGDVDGKCKQAFMVWVTCQVKVTEQGELTRCIFCIDVLHWIFCVVGNLGTNSIMVNVWLRTQCNQSFQWAFL